MKQSLFAIAFFLATFFFNSANAQDDPSKELSPTALNAQKRENDGMLSNIKRNPATPVKDQSKTGTCWSFSTTSLVESQVIKNRFGAYDLSEMFTVRHIYVEKAKNYILRQGHTQFSEGGLGHDMIQAVANYGAVPERVYSGLINGEKQHDHGKLFKSLKRYLDSTLKVKTYPVNQDWLVGYNKILDNYLGPLPENFSFNNTRYSPVSFARDALHFNAADYVNITSFTDHAYYKPFVISVPDNFSNGTYYNLPLAEMISLVKEAIANGYTILWDADVSNNGFRHKTGLALNVPESDIIDEKDFNIAYKEEKYDEKIRQQRYEGLVTQDDHLMHIVGIGKSPEGNTFFMVKNSWGAVGPLNGYINVSEAYFAINTISLVVPKAAISKSILGKCNIQP
jgi:bleomycin hydrolase